MLWQTLMAMGDLGRMQEIASIVIRYGFGDIVRRIGLPNALERAGEALVLDDAGNFAHMTPTERVRQALVTSMGYLVIEMPSPSTSTSRYLREKSQQEPCATSKLRIRLYPVSLQFTYRDQSAISGLHPPVAASQSIPAPCTTACRVSKRLSRQIKQYFPQICLSHAIRDALIANFLPRHWDARGFVSSSAFPIGLPTSLTKGNRNRAGHVSCRHQPRKGPIMPNIRSLTAAPKAPKKSGTKDEVTLRLPETGFLRQPQVLCFVPFSKSTLWRRIQAKTFPHPIKLSARVTVWRAEDIHSWIAEHGA